MGYAKGTEVSAEKSRVQVEQLLAQQKATKIGVMHEAGEAVVYFEINGWAVQRRLTLPTEEAAKKVRSRGWQLDETGRRRWVEQQTREQWRRFLLVLKADFTAIESGIRTFEQCFLSDLVLGGQPIGDKLLPALHRARATGGLLSLGSGENKGGA